MKVESNFKKSISGYLESILIVYLLDLPSLVNTNEEDIGQQHLIWNNPTFVQDLDRSIGSNLGTLGPHGPPMLGMTSNCE